MTTGFLLNGIDADQTYITKDYLLDQYPNLMENMKTPQLFVCGYNTKGQLGTNNTSNYSSPVTTVAGGTNWKSVSCGNDHTAAIKTDGTLWVWGGNVSGQLGANNTVSYSSPVTTIAAGNNWNTVSCGYNYTAAIKTDGSLWTWGRNSYGELGTNNTVSYSSPVTTIAAGNNWKTVSCGFGGPGIENFVAAIKTDGTLWVWGGNSYGQLGTNDTTNRSSPTTTTGTNATNWKSVSCGKNHVAAIKTDGTLWTWGANFGWNLGTNNTTSYSSPRTTVAGGNNWKQVSCLHETLYGSTAAIKTDGTLWVWGGNTYGQLGTNDTSLKAIPTQIDGSTNWKSVHFVGKDSTAAIKTDGTLWVWGYNSYSELGTNNTTTYSSPRTTVAQGTNWKYVTGGSTFLAAISESEGW